jgi:CysZ protein
VSQVLTAFGSALRDLCEPRILVIALLPMLGALAIWAALSWVFWDHWTAAIKGLAAETAAARWLENVGMSWITRALAALGVIALLAPATLISAVLITEIVAMPAIIAFVGVRYYAGLVKKAGGTFASSIINSIVGIAVFCALWLVTLPLWLTGIAALVLPPLLSAYLNQRLFRYDALAEHASRDEYRRILAEAGGRLYVLGLLLGALYYVPLVNLLVPVLSALAYTHFCLGELHRLRSRAACVGPQRQFKSL